MPKSTASAVADKKPASAKKPKIKLADLASPFFVGMSAKTHPGTREWLLDLCRTAGFAGKILQEADIEPTALKFVTGGLGVVLLPEQVMELPHASRPSPGALTTPHGRSRITFRS